MPRYYDYYAKEANERPSFGTGFNEVFKESLNDTMEQKRKSRDFELQLRKAGAVPEDELSKVGIDPNAADVKPYTQRISILGKVWYITPTPAELVDLKKKQSISNSQETPEEKRQNELKQFEEQEKIKSKYAKPPVDEEDRAYQREAGKQKYTARKDLRTINEENNETRQTINEVKNSLKNIPTGVYGSVNRFLTQRLDPNNPINADYQKIRGFLTNQALLRQVLLKGSTSDRDVNLVLESVAGKRDMSVPAILSVIDEAQRNADAKERAAIKTFRDTYDEDPMTWRDFHKAEQKTGSAVIPTINTQEEYDALPAGAEYIDSEGTKTRKT